jgi:hypothetical protein
LELTDSSSLYSKHQAGERCKKSKRGAEDRGLINVISLFISSSFYFIFSLFIFSLSLSRHVLMYTRGYRHFSLFFASGTFDW